MALDCMRRVGTGHRNRIPGTRAEISLFEVPDPQNRPEQHLAAARAQLLRGPLSIGLGSGDENAHNDSRQRKEACAGALLQLASSVVAER